MTRAILISLALASIAYALADRLAAHDWLTAVPLGLILLVGLFALAPGASAHPSPATAAEDALATGEGS